jgi:uncharacterized repeat protein (TIGR01451 family)
MQASRWIRRVGVPIAAATALGVATAALAAGSQRGTLKPGQALNAAETFRATSAKDVGRRARSAPTRNGLTSVIVKLDVEPVASYDGGVAGYGPTTPHGGQLNMAAPNTQRYLAYVQQSERAFAQAATAAIAQTRVTAYFDIVYGGVAMLVPTERIAELRNLKSVISVQRDELLQLQTDRSPSFIGADTIWDQLAPLNPAVPQNEIVGVLDTGIWPEHLSFSNPDSTGTPYPAPPPPLGGVRQCEFAGGAHPGPPFVCQDKLIGADRFMATYDALIGLTPAEYTTARDDEGHGTHTASTAAGNYNVSASIFGIPRGNVSGIANRAHVMAYKVCGLQGCFGSDSIAAINKAIPDGVNVINFSISGGGSPYSDPVELAFLDAYNAGIFVAASAGNSGPAPDTVAHRGPWVTSVAASTHDRGFVGQLMLGSPDASALTHTGVTITPGISSATPVVYAGNGPYNDPLCLNATPDGAFSGKIVVCQRGGASGRAEKGFNILQRGAVGMILFNQAGVTDLETDNHWLPAIQIQNPAGVAVVSFINSHPSPLAVFSTGAKTTVQGDVMATFSSRGGPGQTLGVSKPDVTAPGVSILAGNTPTPDDVSVGPPGQLFQAIAGTSMSSPHVAGAGALLKALHPSWTPGQIKSALMTTALNSIVTKEDGVTTATPFDDGSGRIDLTRAGNPGITFDVSASSYIASQNNLFQTNYPSIYIPNMPGIVTLQRTARSVLGTSATWEFDTFLSPATGEGLKLSVPHSINVPAGGATTFNITIDGTALPQGAVRHGYIRLKSGPRINFIPVTIVRGQTPITFNKTCSPASIPLGGTTNCTVTATNTTLQTANVTITDQLPHQLTLNPASVVGATPVGNGWQFTGTIAASAPPNVTIGPGPSAAGYVPLSLFGVPPVAGVGDDTLTNFNTATFNFAGEVWSSIGFASNGYAVVGGGSGPDNTFINQNLPNPTRPNNVLAPFWTDLNPGAAGAMRIATLTDGLDTWIVLDWEAVREFSTPGNLHSFQIWIGINSDANPAEDVSYAFGAQTGAGDGGFLTVGAENRFGNRGNNVYYNGAGTLPTNGTELRVTSTPGTTTTKTITFSAVGSLTGAWRNCAQMTSDVFFGTAVACFDGQVT